MGFVKAVVGELFQKVENLRRLFLVDAVFRRAFFELGTFGVHRLLDLLAHGTAQEIRAAQTVARHDLRDLHHLFLIDDNALSFLKDMVDQRVNRLDLAQPVLNLAIGRNVLHRTRTVERDERNDILDTGRLHPLECVHHARGFNLEHCHRLGRRVERIGLFVIQRDQVDLVLRALRRII